MPKCEACGEEFEEGQEHVCKKPEEGGEAAGEGGGE